MISSYCIPTLLHISVLQRIVDYKLLKIESILGLRLVLIMKLELRLWKVCDTIYFWVILLTHVEDLLKYYDIYNYPILWHSLHSE